MPSHSCPRCNSHFQDNSQPDEFVVCASCGWVGRYSLAGMGAMRNQDMLEACMDLMSEIQRSIRKHGDWSGYDSGHICKAVSDEYEEYMSAYILNDFNGEHGQEAELLQLACTAIKGRYRLKQLRGAACIA